MKFTRNNNPSKRRKVRRLTENEQRLMDEARVLMLEAERNGNHEGARMMAVALDVTINK